MNNKVIIVTKEGKTITLDAWQKAYGLPLGSDKIGTYYSLKEPKLAEDLEDYDELVVNELLIRFLDALRAETGPKVINSFNRNQAKQDSLYAQGLKTAKTSPHVVYMAADIDTKTAQQTRDLAKAAEVLAKRMGIKIRIGTELYLKRGQTFMHVDVCPEFYGKGKPFHNHAHPTEWESPLKW